MIIFGFILYILLVVLLGVSALAYLSPILIGLAIVVIGNAVSKVKRGKMAPILWNIVTVGVTIFATGMLWKDIMNEAVDTGPLLFIILSVYGLVSLIVFALPEALREQKERIAVREVVDWEDLPERTQKRIRTSRIVAIVSTVMAGIGAIIVVTGSANISESLPPTIMFAIVAIICWVIAGKKHYQTHVNTVDVSIPEAFSRAVSDEYREILGEEPSQGYVKAVYDEYQEWDENLREGLKKGPSGKEYDWKLRETWEDYPVPDYDAVHTYCEVAFDDSGRTYYYRTRNPELKAGDMVIVPVGRAREKKIGRIVRMENIVGSDIPYPLEKTKFIIGKVK